MVLYVIWKHRAVAITSTGLLSFIAAASRFSSMVHKIKLIGFEKINRKRSVIIAKRRDFRTSENNISLVTPI